MNTKELLFALCEQDSCGQVGTAADYIYKYVSELADVTCLSDGGILAQIDNNKDYTVCIEAHYDQIGFVVTEVLEGGFLKVAAVGGIDKRPLAATRVKIYGKQTVCGVFTSVPPHLKKEQDKAADIEELFVDTGLISNVKDIISVGDRAVFFEDPVMLSETVVSSKSLDNRAGCVAIIKALEGLKGERSEVNLKFLFADKEELGLRGATTGAYTVAADETIAVDVSFADAPSVPAEKVGRLGCGGMICLSPTLTKSVSNGLTAAADSVADWQYEVTGGRTGTDIDAMSVVGSGCAAGLISVPLRNMHTGVEVIDIKDIDSVAQTLIAYIKAHKGGAKR